MEKSKPMFYYGMVKVDDHLVPVVTVASRYNPEDGTVNRGIAICSGYDNPSKKEGRKIALKRLAIAEARELDCQEINWSSDNIIHSGAAHSEFTDWKYKVQYHQELINLEKRVFLKEKTK
jgi:hypothetical protein